MDINLIIYINLSEYEKITQSKEVFLYVVVEKKVIKNWKEY